jgi:hypothetical protein
MTESPTRTSPLFDVGEPVWSTSANQVRIVTAMVWRGTEPHPKDPRRRRFWGWVLKTAHPDDPSSRGEGYEGCYQKICD